MCQALSHMLHVLTQLIPQKPQEKVLMFIFMPLLVIMPTTMPILTSVFVSYFLTVLGHALVIHCLSGPP